MGELKTAPPAFTTEDLVEIETRHPIMIGSPSAFGRIEQPAVRHPVKKVRLSKRAHGARRKAARKR